MTAIWSDSQDISLSERDRIFERFHRGDSTLIQKIEGSGLGLSLAREIARVYGKDANTTTNKQSSTTNRESRNVNTVYLGGYFFSWIGRW